MGQERLTKTHIHDSRACCKIGGQSEKPCYLKNLGLVDEGVYN